MTPIQSILQMVETAKQAAEADPAELASYRGAQKKAVAMLRSMLTAKLESQGFARDYDRDEARKYTTVSDVYHKLIYSGITDEEQNKLSPAMSFEEVDTEDFDKAWASVDEEDRRAERGIKI